MLAFQKHLRPCYTLTLKSCFTSNFSSHEALLLCILRSLFSRNLAYCVVGVLCRSLFVSDFCHLSTSILPASECKAASGTCRRLCSLLNEVPNHCALELESEPLVSSAEAPLFLSFLSPWFLRSNCQKFHLGSDGKLRILSF